MNYRRARVLTALSFFSLLLFSEQTFAAPSARSVQNKVRQLESESKLLVRQFKKLSKSNQASVVAALARLKSTSDSDQDGVSDFLELTPGMRCRGDSDNDGLDDGDEYENLTNPRDRDSDDDGLDDGEDDGGGGSSDSIEVEVKGRLVAKSSSEITVGTTTFVINGSTQYRQGSVRSGLDIDDFDIGDCVEAEGDRSNGVNTASKVSSDDDCFP